MIGSRFNISATQLISLCIVCRLQTADCKISLKMANLDLLKVL